MSQFAFHQLVFSKNGPGVVQGRIFDASTNTEKILVSHEPGQNLPPEIRAGWFNGPWVLWAYLPDELSSGKEKNEQPRESNRG